jgi:N-acetylglucosamine-6-phosphate deacetylase
VITDGVDAAAPLDATGLTVTPGFIDLQVNGAYGHDFTLEPESIWKVARRLPETGVTGFLPTIITAEPGAVAAAQKILHDRPPDFEGAEPLGLHVEGPMISPRRRGTHPERHLVGRADASDWARSNGIAMVTLAPELPGALETIVALAARGVVVSLGHSDASVEQAAEAADAGATFGTHLFNAMSSITSREPGLAGFLLTDPRMRFGFINDRAHLDDRVVQLIWASAGERAVLITDAIAATGVGDGTYTLGDITVTVHGNVTRNERGGLAGSALTMNAAVRNLVEITDCGLSSALAAASARPAEVMALDGVGTTEARSRADLVLLDAGLSVAATIVGGRVVFLREPDRLNGSADVAP